MTRTLSYLILLACLTATPAAAQDRDQQWRWCADTTNHDLSIGSCTALIRSGSESTENLALAFYNRGNTYGSKGRPMWCDA